MKPEEIAMQITLKAMDKSKIYPVNQDSNEEHNSSYAKEISNFYKTIYEGIKETKSENEDNTATTQ